MVDVTDFGVIKDVMYAVLSFVNAAFLNPSEFSDICPKFELELVTEASPPDSALKCFAYPIANTDTICKIALFDILTCLVSQPLR